MSTENCAGRYIAFWEACDLADSVWFGENSKEKLFELLDDAVKDEIQGAA